eukprot:TRINITY_DN942_c1_g1_i1.p1 TRINITY_DN942_c1_g1~~TRINITY_DN942_c1_g1_i1.p1  ORF type:complete len:162 (+),score=24.26 TRINITY_DN942_c1_g1_i1:45-530(+)
MESVWTTTLPNGRIGVRSCGFLIMRKNKLETNEVEEEFLLMDHGHRLDLPKGHRDIGETSDVLTALRELREETGILEDQIDIIKGFEYTEKYNPYYKRFKQEVEKTLVIFVAYLKDPQTTIHPTEHGGFKWVKWNPPHSIQKNTIDPLLNKLHQYRSVHKI